MGTKEKETKEKPLDKMTIKDLKELALKIPEITGVHGMNKAELITEINKSRGIVEKKVKKSTGSIRIFKKKIRELKIKRESAISSSDKKMASIFKRKIKKLKQKTRRAA